MVGYTLSEKMIELFDDPDARPGFTTGADTVGTPGFLDEYISRIKLLIELKKAREKGNADVENGQDPVYRHGDDDMGTVQGLADPGGSSL